MIRLLFSCTALALTLSACAEPAWLDNGVIRVGADLELGGAITWLGPSGTEKNLINNHDWGRQIQMSFYSGPVPFEPDGKKPDEHWKQLGWNPIQSGDCRGNKSTVLSWNKQDDALHIVCRPMQWPLDNVPGDCTFESRITLEGSRVHLRGRLNNARNDTAWYEARAQELPAVYTNGVYWRLMTYTGDAPWTDGPLERITQVTEPGFPWKFWNATEHWAALVNNDDWGLGVIMRDTTRFVGGFSGKEGEGGTHDAPTGYIAPLRVEQLDPNIVYDFACTFVLGSLDEIRAAAKEIAGGPRVPEWRFEQDRQGWYYRAAKDSGWPVQGALEVTAAGKGAAILSPDTFWTAEKAPALALELEAGEGLSALRISWRRHGEDSFRETNAMTLDLEPERKVYRVVLKDHPQYEGAMLQLRLDFPGSTPAPGDPLITLKSVRLTQ